MLDVLVIGLGAMGSAALFHVAERGASVLGIDANVPPHTLGSTHGRSRIIREAYFEHPTYVPLVRRAFHNWAALERRVGRTLYRPTFGLMVGRPDSGLVRGTLESSRRHDIPVEVIDAQAIRERFPALLPRADMVGVLEHNAGVLDPEACVTAYLDAARAAGATVVTGERVTRVESTGDSVTVRTAGGTHVARRVIIAAGPWAGELLAGLGVSVPLTVERQSMHWFAPRAQRHEFDDRHLPVTLIEHDADRYFYLIPDVGHGVKAAIHYEGAFGNADDLSHEITDADVAPVVRLLEQFAPDAVGQRLESSVCLYTNTPDHHFIVDAVPGVPLVTLMSPCSGHGFKFASALGEVVAQQVLGEPMELDVSRFGADRFA